MTSPPRQPLPVTTRVRRLVPGPIRRAAARLVGERRAIEVERALSALAQADRPIVVGPWLGEVGFELLYWVPFVRWAIERFSIAPERLIVVTRGGAATWYGSLAARSVDALTFMTPEQFRAKNDERNARLGEQKQVAAGAIDDELIERVRREAGDVAVLHPAMMYRLFAPYWWGHQTLAWVQRRARYQRLEAPAIDLDLPNGYTAVKFYFNDSFPNTPANQAFVERTLAELERSGPVVSLSSGVVIDDHGAYEPGRPAPHGIAAHLAPHTNLLVQSAIVARARRFVGTYGGFAYLAPFYGVPAETYYSRPGVFSVRHLDLAQDALARLSGGGGLTVRLVAEESRP